MPFTLVHGLLAYLAVCPFTKSKKLRLLAFVAGMLPDLDGIPILFDTQLFYAVHHELFHAPIYGILFAVPVALLLSKYLNMDRVKTFAVFAFSFILHSVTDVFFTNWPVKLLWPFSGQQFSYPVFMPFNLGLVLIVVIALVFQFLRELRRKPV